MTRVDVSLYGEDADAFEEVRDVLDERTAGRTPTNADVLRVLMTEFEE